MAQGEEKTEHPTDLKLRQAREKGQVAKSADIVTFMALTFTLLFLAWFMPLLVKKIIIFFRQLHVIEPYESISQTRITEKLYQGAKLWFWLSLSPLLVASMGAIVGSVGQFGFLLSAHPITPDLKKLNALAGLKKIFSKDRAVEFIKQVLKFSLIFWVLYEAIHASLFQISLLFRPELGASISIMAQIVSKIMVRVLICFFLLAIFDLFYQRHSFLKSMRMSKYEVKKEYKQQEGDPHIKQERRRMHQELQESSASQDVGEAAVVITNPRHVAVAIKYTDGVDAVPRLIAKGTGRLAKDLIKEAHRQKIPVLRNVPLARDLQWLSINEEIPQHLYDSVAEVLIFIYELNLKHQDGKHEN